MNLEVKRLEMVHATEYRILVMDDDFYSPKVSQTDRLKIEEQLRSDNSGDKLNGLVSLAFKVWFGRG